MRRYSAALFFDPDETEAVYLLRGKSPPPKATVNPLLRQIACLGGFLARKGDGERDVKTIWLGLKDLQVAVKMMRALRSLGQR
ncbi:IS4 family transposase [Janthinobacterium sp. SUN211]|uniref:IS4 family transposase n=1 Tax=Janthinobacterium sp. SUN211 TaxID=3014786 RepID=UPI0035108930